VSRTRRAHETAGAGTLLAICAWGWLLPGSSVAAARREGAPSSRRDGPRPAAPVPPAAAANAAPPGGGAAAGASPLCAGCPAPAGWADVSMAARLLPLTNLSALTTAQLLDASPGLSNADARRLVRLHQELWCAARPSPDPPASRRVPFANVTMWVHAAGDFVSDALAKHHQWEPAEIQWMLWCAGAFWDARLGRAGAWGPRPRGPRDGGGRGWEGPRPRAPAGCGAGAASPGRGGGARQGPAGLICNLQCCGR
jgi:hypothetical protein